ncbi:MAG TPA: hypothetical protein VK116_08485 [Planctomycetota bacterium]|nr:hypothetical protein [Planctomycetota bacterium]
MKEAIPSDHPLRELFQRAVDRAFREFGDLYAPDVAEHIGEHVLADFVHIDRLYRLRDSEGRQLEELADMVDVAQEKEGLERRLEVDRYIGDFILFMGGFFPSFLGKRPWVTATPMVSRVGKIVVSFRQPRDWYLAEARNAYSRAADTARLFDPTSHSTFRRLGEHVEGYVGVVSRVKDLLSDDPEVRDIEGIFA